MIVITKVESKITHERAKECAQSCMFDYTMKRYIEQQEALEAEHEALKRDVARYFDLLENYEDYTNEFRTLYEELSKVGKEE